MMCSAWRKRPKNCGSREKSNGGTPYTDQLEDDRAFGQEELKKNGISILYTTRSKI